MSQPDMIDRVSLETVAAKLAVAQAALAWLSTVNVGPGGYPRQVVQRVASAAARGGDWRAVIAGHHAKRGSFRAGHAEAVKGR